MSKIDLITGASAGLANAVARRPENDGGKPVPVGRDCRKLHAQAVDGGFTSARPLQRAV